MGWKRHNPEKRAWHGISYKKGGNRISELRQKALLDTERRQCCLEPKVLKESQMVKSSLDEFLSPAERKAAKQALSKEIKLRINGVIEDTTRRLSDKIVRRWLKENEERIFTEMKEELKSRTKTLVKDLVDQAVKKMCIYMDD